MLMSWRARAATSARAREAHVRDELRGVRTLKAGALEQIRRAHVAGGPPWMHRAGGTGGVTFLE